MSAPRISVLMTIYNGAAFLRPAIESVLAQSFCDFEFVLVDDGSADESRDIVRSFADVRIRLIEAPHAGLTAALNRGGAACRGDLIARMDADDIAAPERFAAQADRFDREPDLDVLCSDARLIDARGQTIGAHRMGDWNGDILREALLHRRRAMPIIHPSVMMRRKLFARLEGYRDFACAEDHDFWLRAMGAGARFDHVARPLLSYRVHAKGLSRAKRVEQAKNSLMSVVAHLAREKTGVDLFVERPDLLHHCREEIGAVLAREILPAEASFATIKKLTRAGDFARGALAFACATFRHGAKILPARRRAFLRRLSESSAARVADQLRAARLGRVR